MLLTAEKITMKFGGLVAVDNVDFAIDSGEIRAIIGPNGAGKSTFFNAISGQNYPTSGRILFDGRDITKLPSHRIAKLGMTRTFQNILLFDDMTVLENVMVGDHINIKTNMLTEILCLPHVFREERRCVEKAEEMLDFVGLLPYKDQRSASLPYGKKRLLEIARAMVSGPKLLLLDEPAAGMNAAESAELVDTIRRISQRGVAVLIVEHNMKVIMNISHRITVLEQGKVIAEGEPAEIQANERVIQAYLGKEA